MHIVSLVDNLHEMSKLIYSKNKKNVIDLSSAEFSHIMLMVKHII